MKKSVLFTALMAGSVVGSMAAVSVVKLDNYVSDNAGVYTSPIFYLAPGTQAPGDVYVEVWGGKDASSLANLWAQPIKATFEDTTGDGQADMYLFDVGKVAELAGVVAGGDATFKLRAWTGATTFDTAATRGESATWVQKTASWDKDALPQPTPPTDVQVMNPAVTMTEIVPEPTTIALALIGGAALFLRRRQ